MSANECGRCSGCAYNRYFSGSGSTYLTACHYLLDTGKMRGCSPERCTRYLSKETARTRANKFKRF